MAKTDAKVEIKGKAFLGWIGGKSRLVRTLVPLIPPHESYVEVFGGAAWLTFAKEPSKNEIINDINSELVNLYRVVQHHLPELLRYFEWSLVSREEFTKLRDMEHRVLTDVQRAARFYYIMRTSFGSKLVGQTFGVATTHKPRLNLARMTEQLKEARERLKTVYIENLPYDKCIERFDKPSTFFYVDPPYWDCEDYYGKGIWTKADFTKLRDLLGATKGKWLMSINDAPQIRELFEAYNIKEVSTRYTVSDKANQHVTELLIANYEI